MLIALIFLQIFGFCFVADDSDLEMLSSSTPLKALYNSWMPANADDTENDVIFLASSTSSNSDSSSDNVESGPLDLSLSPTKSAVLTSPSPRGGSSSSCEPPSPLSETKCPGRSLLSQQNWDKILPTDSDTLEMCKWEPLFSNCSKEAVQHTSSQEKKLSPEPLSEDSSSEKHSVSELESGAAELVSCAKDVEPLGLMCTKVAQDNDCTGDKKVNTSLVRSTSRSSQSEGLASLQGIVAVFSESQDEISSDASDFEVERSERTHKTDCGTISEDEVLKSSSDDAAENDADIDDTSEDESGNVLALNSMAGPARPKTEALPSCAKSPSTTSAPSNAPRSSYSIDSLLGPDSCRQAESRSDMTTLSSSLTDGQDSSSSSACLSPCVPETGAHVGCASPAQQKTVESCISLGSSEQSESDNYYHGDLIMKFKNNKSGYAVDMGDKKKCKRQKSKRKSKAEPVALLSCAQDAGSSSLNKDSAEVDSDSCVIIDSENDSDGDDIIFIKRTRKSGKKNKPVSTVSTTTPSAASTTSEKQSSQAATTDMLGLDSSTLFGSNDHGHWTSLLPASPLPSFSLNDSFTSQVSTASSAAVASSVQNTSLTSAVSSTTSSHSAPIPFTSTLDQSDTTTTPKPNAPLTKATSKPWWRNLKLPFKASAPKDKTDLPDETATDKTTKAMFRRSVSSSAVPSASASTDRGATIPFKKRCFSTASLGKSAASSSGIVDKPPVNDYACYSCGNGLGHGTGSKCLEGHRSCDMCLQARVKHILAKGRKVW